MAIKSIISQLKNGYKNKLKVIIIGHRHILNATSLKSSKQYTVLNMFTFLIWRRKGLEGYIPKNQHFSWHLSLGHGIMVDIYHIKIYTYLVKNNLLKCLLLYYPYNKKFKGLKSK